MTDDERVGLAAEQAWIEAGLLDPERGGATDRLELLRWLTEQGITLEEMVRADVEGRLFAVVGDRITRGPGPRLTPAECAAEAGLTVERFLDLWQALGFPDPAPAMPLLTASEAETFSIVGAATEMLGDRAGEQLAATISQAMRTIAEAVNVAYIAAENDFMLDRSGSELVTAQLDAMLDAMIPSFHRWLGVLHVLHHEATNRHLEFAYGFSADTDVVRLGVGFADVSGYTSLSNRLRRDEFAHVVTEFPPWAADQIRRHEAQLVKVLGDGVLFVGPVESVVAAALELVRPGAAPAGLDLHAGVTYGDVLPIGGDYFGPTVNLAARLCDQAGAGVVLADEAAADRWRSRGRARAQGTTTLKGIEGEVPVWSLDPPPNEGRQT